MTEQARREQWAADLRTRGCDVVCQKYKGFIKPLSRMELAALEWQFSVDNPADALGCAYVWARLQEEPELWEKFEEVIG